MSDAIDTSSEAWRHECEVRFVVTLPSHVRRKDYLDGVEVKRGKVAADRLRLDAWERMRVAA